MRFFTLPNSHRALRLVLPALSEAEGSLKGLLLPQGFQSPQAEAWGLGVKLKHHLFSALGNFLWDRFVHY